MWPSAVFLLQMYKTSWSPYQKQN